MQVPFISVRIVVDKNNRSHFGSRDARLKGLGGRRGRSSFGRFRMGHVRATLAGKSFEAVVQGEFLVVSVATWLEGGGELLTSKPRRVPPSSPPSRSPSKESKQSESSPEPSPAPSCDRSRSPEPRRRERPVVTVPLPNPPPFVPRPAPPASSSGRKRQWAGRKHKKRTLAVGPLVYHFSLHPSAADPLRASVGASASPHCTHLTVGVASNTNFCFPPSTTHGAFELLLLTILSFDRCVGAVARARCRTPAF